MSRVELRLAALSREILSLYGDPHDQVPLKSVSHVIISPQVQSWPALCNPSPPGEY